MSFVEYPSKPWKELLPNCSEQARDLVSALVQYQSSDRLTAEGVSRKSSEYSNGGAANKIQQASNHAYFHEDGKKE